MKIGSLTLKNPRRWPQITAAILTLSLAACADTDDDRGPSDPFAEKTVGLTAFESCQPLLDYMQREAIERVERGEWGGYYGVRGGAEIDLAMGAPEAAPSADDASGGGQSAAHSETNNQEAGVDEPDMVKTDGEFIYLLHAGSVFIYRAEDLTLESETPVGQGNASSLLVDEDQLLVFEHLWGGDAAFPEATRLQDRASTAMSLFDISDRGAPTLQRRLIVEGNFISARLVGRVVRAVISSYSGPDLTPAYEAAYAQERQDYGEPPMAQGGAGGAMGTEPGQATEVEPQEAPAPSPAPVETRRSALTSEEILIAEATRIIRASTLEDWIPYAYDLVGEERTSGQLSSCGHFYRPGERGGLGVTSVITLDLDQPTARFDDPAIIAEGATVYASATGLYVTTHNWHDFRPIAMTGVAIGGDVAVSAPASEPATGTATREAALEADEQRQATQIHRFDISRSAAAARYTGSGRVFGTVLNQFSLGEHEGHLRVATTEQRYEPEWRRVNHVFVLGQGGEHGLEVKGTVTDIAEGESIYAVRFLGDRGFIVTFLQVDPLFTLDLSNPSAPRLVGELKIPGFSTYLHPVDDDFILGIGQAGDESGLTGGMQLSLFDVSDFADPKLADTQDLGQDGWSPAGYDHHAFLYWAPEALLAIPVSGWDQRDGGYTSSLDLFSLDTANGFGARGSVDHADLNNDYEGQIQRSLIIGDALYSISMAGLKSHALSDLSPRAAARLPARGY
ncbi:beta-propeller domain-containing protein [Myxococcota bacterium]|nr:beta-propeller domain-containing protein [Myxococcota bacterium]